MKNIEYLLYWSGHCQPRSYSPLGFSVVICSRALPPACLLSALSPEAAPPTAGTGGNYKEISPHPGQSSQLPDRRGCPNNPSPATNKWGVSEICVGYSA